MVEVAVITRITTKSPTKMCHHICRHQVVIGVAVLSMVDELLFVAQGEDNIYYIQHNEPFSSESAIEDDGAPASNHYNRAPVSFPHQKFSHRGAANCSCRPRGAMGRGKPTDMDSNNNTAFPPSMRSRLGPKYSPKQQSLTETTSIISDVPKPCGTYTKEEKKSDVFWISDLRFVEFKPDFKAKCIKVESSKNITLRVTSGQTKEQPTDLDSMLQSVGSSLKNISDPEPGRLCVARIHIAYLP